MNNNNVCSSILLNYYSKLKNGERKSEYPQWYMMYNIYELKLGSRGGGGGVKNWNNWSSITTWNESEMKSSP